MTARLLPVKEDAIIEVSFDGGVTWSLVPGLFKATPAGDLSRERLLRGMGEFYDSRRLRGS